VGDKAIGELVGPTACRPDDWESRPPTVSTAKAAAVMRTTA
jgi:hypothetical protein